MPMTSPINTPVRSQLNTTPRQLTQLDTEPANPQITPDGETVVFASGTADPLMRETYTVGINGDHLQQLTDRKVNLSWQPMVSPDGQKLAYVVEKQGYSDLQLMNLDGSANVNLTNTNKGYWNPAWSPDGKTIVTASRDTRNKALELVAVAADGSSKVQLTDRGLNADLPVFTQDGQNIVFAVAPGFGPAVLCSIKADGSDFRSYARDITIIGKPAVTPDNHVIFSGALPGGRYGLYDQELGSDQRPKKLVSGKSILSPAVSPDGSHIAYMESTKEGYQLFETDREGKNVTQLTASGSNSAPVYTPDGKGLVYLSTRDGNKQVYHQTIRE